MDNQKKFNWDTEDEKRPSQSSEVTPESADTLMTSGEAAALLRLSVKGLRAMALAGKVTFFRIGRSHRYKKSDLLHLLMKVEAKKT